MVLHCKKEQLQKKKEKNASLFLRCDFVFFCQIGVVNRDFFNFFFFQTNGFFSNKWLFFSNKWLFLALRKHSQISSQNTKLCFLLAHFFFLTSFFRRLTLGGPLGVRFCFCYNLLWLTVLTEASEDKSLSVSVSVSVLFRPEVKWFNDFFFFKLVT